MVFQRLDARGWGRLAVQGDLSLKGLTKIESSGWTGAGGTLVAESFGDLLNPGRLAAEQDMVINLTYGSLSNTGAPETEGIFSGGSLILNTGGSVINYGMIMIGHSMSGVVGGEFINSPEDPTNFYTGSVLAVGEDLNLAVVGKVLNFESTFSVGRDLLLTSESDIRNEGGHFMVGRNAVIRASTFTNQFTYGITEGTEHGFERYTVVFDDPDLYKKELKDVPMIYRKKVMVMGYHAQRHYEGVRAILSAGGNLTVDVATGSNEASTIVAGGKVDLRGTWENKSDYDLFSRSWVALDEAIANMDGKVDERWAEGEHMHLSSMDRIEYDGMDAMADGSLAQPRREAVWDYTENELGFDEDAIAIGTGWLAMQATVPFAGVADESYLRFRLIEDYKEDVVHERGIIDGHGGTNVTLLDDDYGVSWAGQGGAEVASLHNLWKPLTGLSPGTKTVAPINAAASVTHLDLSGLAVPHTPVAEVSVNVATPVAPDVNLAIALGDLDSAPQVGLDVLQSQLPTASTLPQVQAPLGQNVTFTLSGYEPLTFLPPGNVPTPGGSIGGSGAGLPGYVFTSSSTGPNPTTGTLPDYYRDGNTLNGYTPTEPDSGTLPNVTLSQALLDRLAAGPSTLGPLLNTDGLRQNVRETLELDPENTFDPEALREASAESSAHLLRTQLTDSLDPTVDITLGDLVDDELKESLAELNTLGAFGGKSVIDFAGPMLNEGSEGVNVLETLEGPPELKDIIAQRHEYYLQQEAELKLKREEWVNQKLLEEYFGDMGHNGWMPEMTPKERAELIAELRANPMFASLIADLETKALDKVGRSHYELIKAQTDAQKQRLHLEMFPPPPPPEPDGGFFGSIWGMIIIAIIAIVVAVFTAGAALGFMGATASAAAGATTAAAGTAAATAAVGTAAASTVAAGAFAAGTSGILGVTLSAGIGAVLSGGATLGGAFLGAGMLAAAAGGFVSSLVTGSLRMIETGGKWFKQVVIPAGIAAVAAAATFGIGHGLDSVIQVPNATGTGVIKGWDAVGQIPSSTLSVGNTIIKPILHGLAQGGISELQGGEFKDGFISASVGSLTGSLTREFNVGVGLDGRSFTGTMLDIALAGASGGAVNTVTGGDFWEGFATASSVALFNDAMRLTQEEKSYPYLGKMVKGYGDSVYWDVQKPDEAGHWLRDGLRNVFSWFSNEPASNSVLASIALGDLEPGGKYIRLGDSWGSDLAGKVVETTYLSDFIQKHPVWNQGDGSSAGYQQAIAQSLSADLNRPVGPLWTYPAGVVDEFLTGIPKLYANLAGIETYGGLMEAAFKNGDILTPYYQTGNFQSGQADSWILQTAAGGIYSISKSGVFSLLDDAALATSNLCFTGETRVLTRAGVHRIDQIEWGQEVWSKDEHSGKEGWQRVERVIVTHPLELWKLSVQRPDGEVEVIRGTANHPIWSDTRQTWVDMGSLNVGEHLRLAQERGAAMVTALEAVPNEAGETYTTYNLTVSQWHTYFVAVGEAATGNQGPPPAIWVHNLGTSLCAEGLARRDSLVSAGMSKLEATRQVILESRATNIAKTVTTKYVNLECVECADDLVTSFKSQGISGQKIEIRGGGEFIISESYSTSTAISRNGTHVGVKVGDLVYDNIHKGGIPYNQWIKDFDAIGGVQVSGITDF